jgi:hypothetical protein
MGDSRAFQDVLSRSAGGPGRRATPQKLKKFFEISLDIRVVMVYNIYQMENDPTEKGSKR